MKINSSAIIQSALTGMGFGFIVTTICVIANIGFTGIGKELAVWLIASALFGILSALVFYSPVCLSLPAAMVIHFVGCTVISIAAFFICGYADNMMDLICRFLPVFLVIYVVIYLICFLVMKLNEKQINASLNKE